jgi:putative ABC transport system permease protein
VYTRAQERVRAVPGVDAVAQAALVPFWFNMTWAVAAPGIDSVPAFTGNTPFISLVSPEYFEATGMRLKRGRAIDASDRIGGPPVAVVGETFARGVWGAADPIGKCFQQKKSAEEEPGPCYQVVGVVEDARWRDIRTPMPPQAYLALAQDTVELSRALFVRVKPDDEEVIARVRDAMQSLESGLPFANVRPLGELIERQTRPWRIGASLFTVFGALALLLAVIGIVGVLGYEVDRRTHEIGVRMALGASARGVVRLILGDVGRVLVWGVALGLVLAYFAGEAVRPLLFSGSPRNPVIYAGVVIVLGVAGLLAGALPARRAAGLQPASVLRGE